MLASSKKKIRKIDHNCVYLDHCSVMHPYGYTVQAYFCTAMFYSFLSRDRKVGGI